MENFTTESRYLKFCNEFRTVIRCMNDAFYRPDYQKLLMCPLIERFCQEFVSKHETLGRAFKTLGRAVEDLREN